MADKDEGTLQAEFVKACMELAEALTPWCETPYPEVEPAPTQGEAK